MQQTYFVSTRQLSMELIARQYTSLVVADIRRRADISVDSWCHKAERHLGDTVIVFDGTGRCKHSDRFLCLNTHWLSRVCNWNSIQHVKTRHTMAPRLTHETKNEISSTSLSQLMNSKKKHTKVLTNPASRGMICVYSDDWKYLHCNVV